MVDLHAKLEELQKQYTREITRVRKCQERADKTKALIDATELVLRDVVNDPPVGNLHSSKGTASGVERRGRKQSKDSQAGIVRDVIARVGETFDSTVIVNASRGMGHAEISEDAVRKILARLARDNEIEVVELGRRGRPSLYRIPNAMEGNIDQHIT